MAVIRSVRGIAWRCLCCSAYRRESTKLETGSIDISASYTTPPAWPPSLRRKEYSQTSVKRPSIKVSIPFPQCVWILKIWRFGDILRKRKLLIYVLYHFFYKPTTPLPPTWLGTIWDVTSNWYHNLCYSTSLVKIKPGRCVILGGCSSCCDFNNGRRLSCRIPRHMSYFKCSQLRIILIRQLELGYAVSR